VLRSSLFGNNTRIEVVCDLVKQSLHPPNVFTEFRVSNQKLLAVGSSNITIKKIVGRV